MSTVTIANPSQMISGTFNTERDLYQYLVDNVIDLDVREHDISEFDQATQQLISSIADRSISSFTNI
jgi:hypothetical protein